MNNTWLFILQALTLIVVLGLIYRPLGDYMAHVYTTPKNLKVERGFYRIIGVDGIRAELARLPAQPAGLLADRRPVRVSGAANPGVASALTRLAAG